MKKLFVIFLCVLFLCCGLAELQAQAWTRIGDRQAFAEPSALAVGSDTSIWIVAREKYSGCGVDYVQRYDYQGNPLTVEMPTFTYGFFQQQVKAKGDFIYTAGYDIPFDDVGLPDRFFSWGKYNSAGEFEYQQVHREPTDSIPFLEQYRWLADFDISPSEKILMCAVDTLYRGDSSGQILNRWHLPASTLLRRVHILAEDRFLVADSNKMYLVDSLGMVLEQQEIGMNWQDLAFSEEHFYVLTQDSIFQWSLDIEPIRGIPVPDSLKRGFQIEWVSDQLHLQSGDVKGENIFISQFDRNLGLETIDIFPGHKLGQPFTATDAAYVVTESQPSLYIPERLHTHKVPFGESLADSIRALDIALLDVDLQVTSTDTVAVDIPGWIPFISFIGIELSIEIENQGSEIIENLALYRDYGGGGIFCGNPHMYGRFDSLSLRPGETKTLKVAASAGGTRGGPERTFCIEILAPNYQLEAHLRQNTLCKDFLLPYIVSNEQELAMALKLYPNPAQDFLRIESPASALAPLQLRLLDMQGRTHQTQTLRQAAVTLDIAELPAGIYVLELMGENTQTWRKWIKE